jgi:fatty acid desaturase
VSLIEESRRFCNRLSSTHSPEAEYQSMSRTSKKPFFGCFKHSRPNFWRYVLATALLACGGVMIGDGVVRWVLDQSNAAIPAGCCVMFLGIIVLLSKQPGSGEQPGEPGSDNAEVGES